MSFLLKGENWPVEHIKFFTVGSKSQDFVYLGYLTPQDLGVMLFVIEL